MKAFIKTSGRQFTVREGDTLTVNRVKDAEPGATIELREVLAAGEGASFRLGRPFLDGAVVRATVLSHHRGDKVIVFKKRKRKGYERTRGHRQELSVLRIESITA